MSKAIRVILFIVILFMFGQSSGFAAVRVLLENFDSGSINQFLTVYDDSWHVMSQPQYNLDAPGRSGQGHCFSSGTERSSYLCWNNSIPNPWPTDEMYVSFWMRYPTFTPTSTNENLKVFYPHWHDARSYVHYAMTDANTIYYSACTDGNMLTYGNWLNCPGQTDGNWHHYEFYVNFAQGISRFWYDGAMKADDTFGTGVWTKDMYYISAPSIEGQGQRLFSRQVDDWEVWDGMPDPAGLSASAAPGPDRLKTRLASKN